ncbi:histidine phosphatase family protein [Streptomyces sp. WZ-12]|uniref:histidine phosphatase family protein n=1 Tax=Streptomyces sp. WZ-12 TaxID=3030210 RepID=UPI002380FDEB|nr:histidine phosphatase family protein [Streptomyces sp. WZ-12]
MSSRVTLITPAMSRSLRQARFGDGEDGDAIDDSAAARARSAAGSLPRAARVRTSPSARCHQTAAALGLDGTDAAELSGLNVGRWTGRTLDEVGAAEPEAVGRWLADPACAPHGGESVRELCGRVARWLDALPAAGRTLAVVEPEVVRAAVVHVLGLPGPAFWRLDVPPLTATELSGRAGRWNLRLGQALPASSSPSSPPRPPDTAAER